MFRTIFIALSDNKTLRSIAERSRVGRRLSSRFVAGMTVDEALTATAAMNSLGMSVSIDNLGENVTNVAEARESASLYHELLDRIAARKLDGDLKLKRILLKSDTYHGIATHDPKMIDATIAFAKAEKIAPGKFEFQMLYGIRRDLQQKLVRDGWRMRVYIPFGTEWYPYLMRRLAERPANAIFILKNVLRR